MAETRRFTVRRSGLLESNSWAHVILTIGAVTMAFPFLWLIIMALSTNAQIIHVPPTWWPGTLRFGNFAQVFRQVPFLSEFRVSITITVLRTVGQLLLCSMAGYAFARMRFRGQKLLFGILLSILLVPPQVFYLPQYQIILQLGLLNTTAGIVLPGFFSAFGVFLMRQFFSGLPVELEEAARLDGCNPWQLFWRVMLPQVKPALSALAVITVLWSWNDLMWPLLVTTYSEKMPLSVGIATLQGQHDVNFAMMMAASLMAMAPVIVAFIAMQRRVIAGVAFSGLK
ncbi:carbohydrate ABC transporter permease [Kribbella sp. NPDC051586]|uniref:carbohydrate ABC transporter permease n=1 Tax=Kribbella sp. NPDC051586 TaxID=3364118 RepID=UPI0037A348DE